MSSKRNPTKVGYSVHIQFDRFVYTALYNKIGNSLGTTKVAAVVDDHPLVARGIADFLSNGCGLDQAHAISNPDDLWQILNSSSNIVLVIIDFWLPDGSSIPLIQRITSTYDIPVLVISADDNEIVLQKARASGASGFLHKQENPECFSEAVTALISGSTWFQHPSKNPSSSMPKDIPVSPSELGLTNRQGEIFDLMLQGMPNKRIAQTLHLSEQTVKEHVSGILERLGVRNRIEAITKMRGKTLEKQQ